MTYRITPYSQIIKTLYSTIIIKCIHVFINLYIAILSVLHHSFYHLLTLFSGHEFTVPDRIDHQDGVRKVRGVDPHATIHPNHTFKLQ